MSHLNTLTKATTLLATAGLASATLLNVPAANAGHNSSNGANCENGQLLGTFALRSERNQQFVKKDDGILKATKNSQPTNTSEKGVFQIYSLKGLPGATDQTFALRSTRSNKWWRVRNNSKVVQLDDYQCRSDRNSTTFIGRGAYGALALQSRKNGKWIKVQSNDKLKAKADNPESNTVFRLVPLGQGSNPQNTQPTDPTPPQANLREDCSSFNPRSLSLRDRGGSGGWTIAQGGRLLFAFGDKKEAAHESLELIKAYGFNQSCFVGRPGPSMTYLKKSGSVPRFSDSSIRPRDCINSRNLSLQRRGNLWVLTNGRSTPLSSQSKEEMVQAKAIIDRYDLTKQCFVGRPNAPFAFWLR